MDKIKVLLIEKPSADRELIVDTLFKIDYIDLVGEAENQDEVNFYIGDNYPDVILIGLNLDLERYELATYLSSKYKDISIIMIEPELKEDVLYRTLFSGAKDVLITPFTSAKLVESIYRVAQLNQGKRPVHGEYSAKPKRTFTRGNVVTVFSTKGGVGKTFIATNLAVGLAKNHDKKVCLVDFDLDFGNTVLALNLVPKYTILDIVENIDNIDQNLIESYLIDHQSGIKVLAANAKPQINEYVSSEHTDKILRALKGAFDYIVIDMPGRFYEPVNPAFQIADILLMVTTPEIATIRNVKSSMQTLHDLNYPKSKIKVILNKTDYAGQIRNKDVEKTLNQSLYSAVSSDYKQAINSLNNGNPIMMNKGGGALNRSLGKLVKRVEAEFEESNSR